MVIKIQSGLALANMKMTYKDKSVHLQDVLLDTGCAMSVFDTDVVEPIHLVPDRKNARLVCMTGIGGRGDFCVEQITTQLFLDGMELTDFRHQLGNIKETYGFDAILGNDFLTLSGLINWNELSELSITYPYVH